MYRATPHSSTNISPNEVMNLGDECPIPSLKTARNSKLIESFAAASEEHQRISQEQLVLNTFTKIILFM